MGPSILGVILSFMSTSLGGDFHWVGLENFEALFKDDTFWTSLRVTLVYSLISVPTTIVVSLVMAQLAARSVRGIKIYRAAFFLPVITSLVTTAVIWRWLYSTNGPMNFVLGLFGVGPVPWLGNDYTVLPALAIVAVWARFGYYMLILLAGLLNIPRDYYEAAELDGAGTWGKFRHVTLPGLKRPLFFVVILDIVQSFQVFDLVYVMTGGGPVRSSYSMVFMIYDQGFRYGYFGYASAVGVVLFAITLVISLVQRRIFRED
ncbi:MAG: sugar ABC transporter permease [Propionibacteriaceae bacterium]|nr:sugar ABC transporter permease [Propionibacteriaceae bacterium]